MITITPMDLTKDVTSHDKSGAPVVGMLTYEGKSVLPYQSFTPYAKGDFVEFNGDVFKSLHHQNIDNPIYKSSWQQLTRNSIKIVEDWEKDKIYTQYDKVKYKGKYYVCEAGRLEGSTPPSESMWWAECGSYNDNPDNKPTTIKVNNDRMGDITADNIVIYGDHTGDISAKGEKSVVVIFGDVTGDITANQVIRLDNSSMDTMKATVLEKTGKTRLESDLIDKFCR